MRESKQTQIYTQLKERILCMDYPPNSILNEQKLCNDFQVSKTPVRQVLQKLVTDGFVEYFPGKGMFVSQICLIDALEIYRIREVLDPLAIESCMLNSADLHRILKKYLELQKTYLADNQYKQYLRMDREFHRSYMEACANERLKVVLKQLSDASFRFSNCSNNDVERAKMSILQHQEIVTAVEACDMERAKEAVRRHMVEVREYLKKKL